MTWRINPKLVTLAMLLVCLPGQVQAELKPDLEGFQQRVKPLLQKYCTQCHGATKQKAKLRFDRMDPDIIAGEHFGQWEDLREAFNTGEMPPEDEPQPTIAERESMTRWLDAEFKKAKLFGSTRQRGRVRRLTRYELRHALEDLLKVSVEKEVNTLPEEGTSLETGLKNNSRLLMISSPHLEAYLNAILSIVNRMKEIAVFEPHNVRADIENLNVNPPVTYAYEKKKNKPPVGKVTRAAKGVVIESGGYIDLKIPSISKCRFQTSLSAKADGPGRVEVLIGFQYSDFDPRQKTLKLGDITIEEGEDLRTYSLSSFPDILPDEMTRALDRPFFIRISNRGVKNLYLESFDYQGNVNTDLTASLIPPGIKSGEIEQHVRRSISSFIAKAFRRSPTEAEFKKYHGVYQRRRQDEAPMLALLSTYKEILCSPDFFYLGLPDKLADYQLAERLAFFLWCSVPDEQLLRVAATGKLTKPSVLAAEIGRMLKNEKSRRWVENFTDQWLKTSQLFNVAVDANYYPRFKDPMKDLMRQETIEAVNDVFRTGAPALDLLKADHVFVNQTLAGFYKLRGVRGEEFRKVAVNEKLHRGGLLTQGTFLIGNSDGMNSHAILRGVWLAEVILNDPPPDPPANVPPLDESIPGFDKMTLNEKLFAHRNNEACRSCHQQIDPWGIPFENYDASGAWREKVLMVSKVAKPPKEEPGKKKRRRRKPVFEKSYLPIERESTLPDGVTVDGIDMLKEYLVTHRKRDFAKGLVERILAYALSRDIDSRDDDLVNHLVDRLEQAQYSVPTLIREIVQGGPFMGKKKTDGI